MRLRPLALALFSSSIIACGPAEPTGEDAAAQTTASTTGDSSAVRALSLSAGDIATATVSDVTTGVILTGSLEPATSVTLTAQVAGAISDMSVDRGSRVNRGQRLATITAEGVRSQAAGARASVAAAEANLAVARTQRDAAQRLYAAGATSRVQAENAEAAYQAAEAQVAAAKAQATAAEEMAGYMDVTSPIDGAVSDRAVEPGEAVSVGDPILTVVNTRVLELAGRVPVDDAASIRIGQPVSFTLDAFGDRVFRGTVARKDPTADASDRQVGVYVRLPNADGELVAGQYARGEVAGRSVDDAITVPATAVAGSGAEAAVFVVEGSVLRRRPVEIGVRDATKGTVVITEGLAEGERVLARPVPGLADGQPITLATDR